MVFGSNLMPAKQLKKLLYFKRIIDEFPTTLTALDVRQHFDGWRNYANNKKMN